MKDFVSLVKEISKDNMDAMAMLCCAIGLWVVMIAVLIAHNI